MYWCNILWFFLLWFSCIHILIYEVFNKSCKKRACCHSFLFMFTIVAERVKEHIFFLKRCLAWNIYIFLMHLLACTYTRNQNFLLPIRISCFKLVDINNCTVWHIIFFLFLKPCMLCILKLRKLCEFSLNIPFSMIFLYLELYMLVEEKIQDFIPLLRHGLK